MTSLDRQRLIVEDSSSRWAVVPTEAPARGLQWWLVADDNETERRGREVVNAFFGPAITRVLPGSRGSEAAGSHLRSVPNALRLQLDGNLTSFLAALEIMTSVRASAPELRRETRDPIGFLIRDFYLALDRGDASASDELLARIEGTGLVGSENLRFLRVDRLARLGRWRELGALAWFAELARARRPIRISEHLLEAVWILYFGDAAVASNPEAATNAYERAEIATRFGVLLRSIDVPSTAPGRRLAALFAGLSGDAARVERIVKGAPTEERGLLDRLTGRAAEAPALPPRSALDTARDMFEDGSYEGVIAMAEAEQSPSLVAMAVRAAFEQNDPRLAVRVVPLIDATDAAALPDSSGFVRIVAAVHRLADNSCSTWSEWLNRVDGDVKWLDAAEIARDLGGTWDVTELTHSSTAKSAAERLLTGSEGVNRRELRAVFDLLCQVAREVVSSPAAGTFVDAVLLVLAADENPSVLVRTAFFDLLMDVLANGPSTDRYKDMLSTTESLWSEVRSREATPWILDVLDGLASHPSPNEGARRALVSTVVASVYDFAPRLTKDERVLFEAIGRECQVAVALPPIEALPATQSADVWHRLNGRLIGIYSLVQGMGARLGDRLAALCGDVRVEQNSDTVATPALRALALNADFLIVDTKHASHAATGAIDAVRSRDRQLFPAGGGISSFIARLREELELLVR
jgi:hypothetical protein